MNNHFRTYILALCVHSLVAVSYNPANFLLTQQELHDAQWFGAGVRIQLCMNEETEILARIEQEFAAKLASLGLSPDQPLPEHDAQVAAIVHNKQVKLEWHWWNTDPIVLQKEQVQKLQSATIIRCMRNKEGTIYLPLSLQDIELLFQHLQHPRMLSVEQQQQLLHTINVLQVGRDVLVPCIQFFSTASLEQLMQYTYASWLRTTLQWPRDLPPMFRRGIVRLEGDRQLTVFAPNSKYLAYRCNVWGGMSGMREDVKIYELDETSGEWHLIGNVGFGACVDFTPDSKFLILSALGLEKFIRIVNLEEMKTGRRTHAVYQLSSEYCLYNYSPDSQLIAYVPDGKTIVIVRFDEETKKWHQVTQPLVGHTSRIRNLVFSQDSKMLVSNDVDGNIKVWKFDETLQQWKNEVVMPTIVRQDLGDNGTPNNIAITADNATIVTTCWCRSYDTRLEFDENNKMFEIRPYNFSKTLCSPDGKFVVSDRLGNEDFDHLRPNLDIYNFCTEDRGSCTVM